MASLYTDAAPKKAPLPIKEKYESKLTALTEQVKELENVLKATRNDYEKLRVEYMRVSTDYNKHKTNSISLNDLCRMMNRMLREVGSKLVINDTMDTALFFDELLKFIIPRENEDEIAE